MNAANSNQWLEKIHYQDDHSEVIRSAGYYSQFLDGDAKMTKSASDAFTKAEVDKWKPDKDHFGLHIIAMGSEESVGPNRNGDSWPSAALEKYHPTFTKFGCFFREHKNRCQKTEGIGTVKAAAYNKPMSRIELVIWGDKRKAEEEYEMAKSGKELSFSMSARMPFDRCSVCDQKSRTQSAYCSHLKNNMLQYIPQMKKYAFARNMDDLKFFDISRVGKRADRVATYLRYMFDDDMAKAASFGDKIITGADWASMEYNGGRGLGSDMLRFFSPWENDTLEKLAQAEKELLSTPATHLEAVRKGAPRAISQSAIELFAKQDFPALGGELAKKGMLLDFDSFASLISGTPVDDLQKEKGYIKITQCHLPSLFGRMSDMGGCECGDAAPMVSPDEFGCRMSEDKDLIDKMIKDVGDNLGMEAGAVASRAACNMDKCAKENVTILTDNESEDFYRSLANAYGYYAVKAAHIAKEVNPGGAGLMLKVIPAMNQKL